MFPFVKENYSITDQKSIIGQSLGGLLATEIHLKSPEMFDHHFIVSPSIWWDSESLLNIITDTKLERVKSIYIAVGEEGKIMKSGAKKLNKLIKKNSTFHGNLYFQFFKECDHRDILHLAIYRGFERVFGNEKQEN